ncbi:hypothetical protein [Aureimonas pseudogalii]|uniref:Uncharacterized protein n=1 Tax=Aureimonas pseudogalii TaxID=1744844 RepID=A0A7W6MLY8_9HYPH|nr:hypothetical protein [Aureimonas pseudogalii]MBB4000255.1 hypothetical protein [Aureimonas pseudogalii]
MAKTRTSRSPLLPAILPGSWKGESVGAASVNFGQELQPGPPRQSIEFTYAIMPVRLTGPGSSFAWPGILAIFVPNPLKPDRPDAGTLSSNGALPALHLTLDVTRVQFSDMLPFLDAERLKEFHFTVEDRRDDGHWPLRSWGMGTRAPEAPQDSPPNG